MTLSRPVTPRPRISVRYGVLFAMLTLIFGAFSAQRAFSRGELQATPDSSIVFQTSVGDCEVVAVMLRATAIVNIDSIQLRPDNGAPFSADESALGRRLGPGIVDSVRVTFCPTDIRLATGTLVIRYTANSLDSVVIALAGQGVLPSIAHRPMVFESVSARRCRDTVVQVVNTGQGTLIKGRPHIGGRSGAFTLRSQSDTLTITGGSSDTVRVVFCPPDSGCVNDVLIITSNFTVDTIPLFGCALPAHLDLDTTFRNDTLSIRTDSPCVDVSFPIHNDSSGVLVVDLAILNNAAFQFLQDSITASTRHLEVDPYSTVIVALRFCGNGVDSISIAPMTISTNGGDRRLVLKGTTPGRVQGGDVRFDGSAWLDTASAHVNDRFSITLHLSKPLSPSYGVSGFKAVARITPTSLYPWRATSPTGAPLTMDYRADNTIVVEQPSSATSNINTATLMQLEMQGLVTGQPANVVELLELTLYRGAGSSQTIPLDSLRNGLVLLDGCDIGKTQYIAKARITGISGAPLSNQTTVTYVTASGTHASLSLIDMTGRERLRIELPEGTGQLDEAHVSLLGLPVGMYMLQLRAGADVDNAPILIAEP